ncbi:PASTA domain-containing protein [Actinokineospora enzanensis]|uniref:PASTA domain-containing protein n=1 Tax=Actinokineospora enzanensis TaxID=155975 RepID=UPI000363BE1B|nr:PASTA domain-containing protein [Actinokineospora enzanensis]
MRAFAAVVALLAIALTGCDPKTTHIPDPPTLVPPSASVKSATVPNVVGMDHQDAQNKMQSAGFYFLTEEDATGQGRQLIVDHNWVVVEQVPPAGTVAPQTEKILLRSKKKTDK